MGGKSFKLMAICGLLKMFSSPANTIIMAILRQTKGGLRANRHDRIAHGE